MEDTEMELEAMQAIYGDDCQILQRRPLRLKLLLKPRTADELSQQFVEILLSINTNDEYPTSLPAIELAIVKGMDATRQWNLLSTLKQEAERLCNEPMLVTISETAVEFLTTNNYPEGECCFCLLPLSLDQHEQRFMKLMSCFHCFHSDCFARWWKWIQNESNVHCPICRAPIHPEDIAHVRDILLDNSSLTQEEELHDLGEVLAMERTRQEDFMKNFEAQRARGGIIEEPKGPLIVNQLVEIEDAQATSSSTPEHTQVTDEHVQVRNEQPQQVRDVHTQGPPGKTGVKKNRRHYPRHSSGGHRAWIRKQAVQDS